MDTLQELQKQTALLQRIVELLEGGAVETAVSADGSFAAVELVASVNEGKVYWKVRGGQFTKFGVTIWPEVLAAAGFNVDNLNPMHAIDLSGWTAHYVTNGDGQPKKITQLVKPERQVPQQPDPRIKTAADWEREALAATDPLIFDAAMAKADAFYPDSDAVRQFREVIFGEYVPAQARGFVAGMKAYADERRKANGSQSAHNRAKTKAIEAFREVN